MTFDRSATTSLIPWAAFGGNSLRRHAFWPGFVPMARSALRGYRRSGQSLTMVPADGDDPRGGSSAQDDEAGDIPGRVRHDRHRLYPEAGRLRFRPVRPGA